MIMIMDSLHSDNILIVSFSLKNENQDKEKIKEKKIKERCASDNCKRNKIEICTLEYP